MNKKDLLLSSLFLAFVFMCACKSSKVNKADDKCVGEENPNLNCIMLYKPVCGCDGITYSNACVANQKGILKTTEGECK